VEHLTLCVVRTPPIPGDLFLSRKLLNKHASDQILSMMVHNLITPNFVIGPLLKRNLQFVSYKRQGLQHATVDHPVLRHTVFPSWHGMAGNTLNIQGNHCPFAGERLCDRVRSGAPSCFPSQPKPGSGRADFSSRRGRSAHSDCKNLGEREQTFCKEHGLAVAIALTAVYGDWMRFVAMASWLSTPELYII
jgi:hypothetical protein